MAFTWVINQAQWAARVIAGDKDEVLRQIRDGVDTMPNVRSVYLNANQLDLLAQDLSKVLVEVKKYVVRHQLRCGKDPETIGSWSHCRKHAAILTAGMHTLKVGQFRRDAAVFLLAEFY
jgi:hypothetical protein